MDINHLPRPTQTTTETKKKRKYSSRTKVRGAKRSLVRVNGAKLKEEQEKKLLNEQEYNNSVYEDVMVFVKNQKVTTSKTRGRPRKCESKQITARSSSKANPSALEVIYMPSVRNKPVENLYWQRPISLSQQYPQVLLGPTPCSKPDLKPNSYKQTLLKSNVHPQSVLEPSVCPQGLFKQRNYSQAVLGSKLHSQSVLVANPFTQSVLGLNLRPQTLKTVLEGPVTVTKYVKTTQEKQQAAGHFPEDLIELVENIEKLPGYRCHHPEELIHWLMTPISYKPSNFPLLVRRFHQQVKEWNETEDNKLQLLSKWLLEDLQTGTHTTQVTPPKVVVESQPNASQQCGLWSSMDHAT